MSTTVDSRPARPSSRTRVAVSFLVVLIGVIAGLSYSYQRSLAAAPAQQTAAPDSSSSPAARGAYLATHVAMCVQCHSGRDRHGDLLESEKFKGGAIPVTSPYPGKEWAVKTPALAGLPGFTDAQIIQLLTEGRAGDRPAPRAPMPPFRMMRQDAEAIVAFLRSR
jgi:mono/diheme cytochrome c family protein